MTSLRELVLGSTNVTVGSLCTGYGGLDLGLLAALGRGRIAWVADCDPHVRTVLAARMRGVPNLGDVRRIDWSVVEPVDVVTTGFPCQDISAAGRRAGIEKGERSGIWVDIMAGVRVLRPTLLVVENVAALRWKNGGLHRVLGDLAEAGYDAVWRSVRASDVGCAHRRERVFLLAWRRAETEDAADPAGSGRKQPRRRGSRAAARAGAPSQPARRGQRADEVASHTNCCGRAFCCDPDGAQLRSADAEGVRHADGLCSAAADLDRVQSGRHLAGDGYRGVAAAVAGHIALRVDWGEYANAVRRWETLLGRDVPFPTQRGQRGRQVLSPNFVEHLMGLPAGWVTDLPLPRTAQLRALGNGVVPQQAAYALALLLADLAELLVADEPIRHEQEASAA